MFQQTRRILANGTSYEQIMLVQAPGITGPCGVSEAVPRPFKVSLGAHISPAAGSTFIGGATFRLTPIGGTDSRSVEIWVDDEAREWSGVALGLVLEAREQEATDEVEVDASVIWYEPGSAILAHTVSNLAVRKTIDGTIATTTDGATTAVVLLGAIQRTARRLGVSMGPWTAGAAMIPTIIKIYGRRFIGGTYAQIGEITVDGTFDGGAAAVIDLVPGQYDALGYSAAGIPATLANSGTAVLQILEELAP